MKRWTSWLSRYTFNVAITGSNPVRFTKIYTGTIRRSWKCCFFMKKLIPSTWSPAGHSGFVICTRKTQLCVTTIKFRHFWKLAIINNESINRLIISLLLNPIPPPYTPLRATPGI